MQKKKQEIIIKCNDTDQLNKYLNNEYNKVVTINVYDRYWGPCDVVDMMIKRFIETGTNGAKCDFICAEKEIAGELFKNYTFTSKPKFFIFHKCNLISSVDGVDIPKLFEEVEKSFHLLDS